MLRVDHIGAGGSSHENLLRVALGKRKLFRKVNCGIFPREISEIFSQGRPQQIFCVRNANGIDDNKLKAPARREH